MLNWIRDRLYMWLAKAEDAQNEGLNPLGKQTVDSLRPREIHGPADMHVSIYRCTNGYVVEGMVFDHKPSIRHHEEPTRHRVVLLEGNPQQLAEAIALLYVRGQMGAAA